MRLPCRKQDDLHQMEETMESALGISDQRTLLCQINLAAAAATAQHPAAFLLIDLDGFRSINHALGHQAGDQLLVLVARRLHVAAGRSDLLGYMGGDEFGLLLDVVRDRSDASSIAEKVLRAMEAPFEVAGREVRISASIGISMSPSDGIDAADL